LLFPPLGVLKGISLAETKKEKYFGWNRTGQTLIFLSNCRPIFWGDINMTTGEGRTKKMREEEKEKNRQKSRRPGKREGAMALTFPARCPTGRANLEGSLERSRFGAWIVGAYWELLETVRSGGRQAASQKLLARLRPARGRELDRPGIIEVPWHMETRKATPSLLVPPPSLSPSEKVMGRTIHLA
jgi:hypothetical protein